MLIGPDGLADTPSDSPADPVSRLLAGFEHPAPSDPAGRFVAGFADPAACLMYRPTVSRWMPSIRAICRADMPRACNVCIELTIAILSRFAMPLLPGSRYLETSRAYTATILSLNMAGFHLPLTGRFCLPLDTTSRRTTSTYRLRRSRLARSA